ncbi:MAG: hypothetical protein EX285_00265 [Thaumarchaeota archaeon]|nr:hypothetical protein [Nitrososphaerota archaeon]NMJ86279.1 hypothetical protein [Nitrososphaerota archaeon]|tara:strand:+ start:2144 stop:2542 length:399 start_codon:yes stop_codon:yes gene_type:complete
MDDGEMEIPKSVRPIMMQGVEETKLGEGNGARKQYRYGNLHIREYDDKYVVHTDKVDPKKDPFGHLIKDSPETLIGIASSIYFGKEVGSYVFNKRKEKSKNILLESLLMGGLASLTIGYLGYRFGKQIRKLK